MFEISGPGVYRRRNGQVVEIVSKLGVSNLWPWVKRRIAGGADRDHVGFFDSFMSDGRCDKDGPTPFDLVELIKLISTPDDHVHGCPSSESNTTAAPQGTVEVAGERIGKQLSFRVVVVGEKTMPIEEAVQFTIQTCGIPAVVQALALDTCPKSAFQKLFAEAMAQTVKRRICSNAEVVLTFV